MICLQKEYMNRNDALFSEPLFVQFAQDYALSDIQKEQFAEYLRLLQEWNEKINLTALTSADDIIAFHFRDSLAINQAVNMDIIKGLADVGTGAGLPAIPIKIMYPDIKMVLIEVNKKRLTFLRTVIDQLNLDQISLFEYDWRTFLRKTDEKVDVVVARASLQPEELMRMFKPGCVYKSARLIYWASRYWRPGEREEAFIEKSIPYVVGKKQRKLVVFGLDTESGDSKKES